MNKKLLGGIAVALAGIGIFKYVSSRNEKETSEVWTTANIPDLTGKVFIVTGANAGLGFEASKEVARKGAKVIMACRSMDKAQAALTQISEEIPDASVEVMQLDLASLKSVHQFADNFKAKYDRLDVLLNNAGIMFLPERRETEDGFEITFGTNCLGHFSLTGLLLDVLQETPSSRVVYVSSFAHTRAELDFDDLMFENKRFNGGSAYGATKLATILYAYELQRRFESTGIDSISVAVDPGYVRTDWTRHQASGNRFNRFLAFLLGITLRITGQSVEMGALPLLRATVDPEVKGGEYFNPGGRRNTGYPVRAESSEASYNEKDAKKLWEISEELTGVSYPLPVPVMT